MVIEPPLSSSLRRRTSTDLLTALRSPPPSPFGAQVSPLHLQKRCQTSHMDAERWLNNSRGLISMEVHHLDPPCSLPLNTTQPSPVSLHSTTERLLPAAYEATCSETGRTPSAYKVWAYHHVSLRFLDYSFVAHHCCAPRQNSSHPDTNRHRPALHTDKPNAVTETLKQALQE